MRTHLLAATLACLIPGLALAAEPTPAAAPAKADDHSKADHAKAKPADKAAKPADESASPASETTTAPADTSTDKPNYQWKAKPDESTTKTPDEPR